jgi:hypothetical protein
LIALIIMFSVTGYRQGFLVGGFSFCGFFAGALVGLQVAPWIVEAMDSAFARVVVSLALVFGLALLGQAAAAWAGGRLRGAITNEHGRTIDDLGGIVVSVIALLLVAWMVAGPLASSSTVCQVGTQQRTCMITRFARRGRVSQPTQGHFAAASSPTSRRYPHPPMYQTDPYWSVRPRWRSPATRW